MLNNVSIDVSILQIIQNIFKCFHNYLERMYTIVHYAPLNVVKAVFDK